MVRNLYLPQIVDNCKAESLLPVIQGKVDIKATINPDSWRSYDGLVSIGYDKLFRVSHGKKKELRYRFSHCV